MKPIICSIWEVRAMLAEREGVMRRVVEPQPKDARKVLGYDEEAQAFNLLCGGIGSLGAIADWVETVKAPYDPGDILYVRETWHKDAGRYMYRANYSDSEKFYRNGREASIKWHPPIHMPKEAARIFFRVKSVRMELWQNTAKPDTTLWMWAIKYERITEEEARKCNG